MESMNVNGVPLQPLADGVTMIVAVTIAEPVLIPVKAGITLEPVPTNPMVVLLLVQLKVVPAMPPEKVSAMETTPLQIDWLDIESTVGVGLTVMISIVAWPVQPLAEAVTKIVSYWANMLSFIAIKDAMFPVPPDARPKVESLFVHE